MKTTPELDDRMEATDTVLSHYERKMRTDTYPPVLKLEVKEGNSVYYLSVVRKVDYDELLERLMALEADVLKAPNPFEEGGELWGCPNCWLPVSCGTPTESGYRQTCSRGTPTESGYRWRLRPESRRKK